MIIGARINPRLVLLLTSLCLMPLQIAEANDATLEAIFKKLATQPRHDIRYTEKKYSGFLDEPLVLTGLLRYLPPDTIIREQFSPEKQKFEITGNVVIVSRKGKIKRIKLDTVPALQVFVDSFRAILFGDLARLKTIYQIEFSGAVTTWSMRLQPRDSMLGIHLETISFEGKFGIINKIVIRENEEDWSEMTLQPSKGSAGHE